MSTLTQFVGGNLPPSSIVNGISTNGWAPRAGANSASIAGVLAAKQVLSGALTATTLKELLAITGGGALKYLAIYTMDVTSRTLRLKIVLDGTAIFDSTSAATTTSGAGGVVVGVAGSNTSPLVIGYESLRFNTSLSIQVASSVSETDKVGIDVAYHLTA